MSILTSPRIIMLLIYGPPGVGKSTIGALLAQQEWKKHIDTDTLFTQRYGNISEFIAAYGEPVFRRKESEILVDCIKGGKGSIVTLGGGTLLNPADQELTSGSGQLITLIADVEVIVDRVMRDSINKRPLASTERDIRGLMAERYMHYTSQRVVYHIGRDESLEKTVNNMSRFIIR